MTVPLARMIWMGGAVTAGVLLAPVSGAGEPPSRPAATAASRAQALALTQVLHTEENAGAILSRLRDRLVQMLERENPGQPPAKIETAVDEVLVPDLEARRHELVAGIAEIYARHFTADELRALQQFYEQPLGQKLVRLMPDIGKESLLLANMWARQAAQEVMSKHAGELRARGLNR